MHFILGEALHTEVQRVVYHDATTVSTTRLWEIPHRIQ